MRYRIIHPDGESTEHSRILFAQEYDGYLSVIYEHVSVRKGVTRLWLVTSNYTSNTEPETLPTTRATDLVTTFTITSCEYGMAKNLPDSEVKLYSGNLINHGVEDVCTTL